jgi:predicted RNA-binding Zn ribbon-like protein
VIHPAPGQLEVVREFVNTVDVEEGKDDLATPESLGAWLGERGLVSGGEPTEADRRRAVALRGALRDLLLANDGDRLDPAAVGALNREVERLPLVLRFGEDGAAELAAGGQGVERALAELLVVVHRAMAEGTWRRLKLCREDTCQWAFFDQSKNRSARWCDMAVCGNRHKVREYRQRSRKSQHRRSLRRSSA